jgi:hypothetical protein
MSFLVEELPLNATFNCYTCLGEDCLESSVNDLSPNACDAGEICWVT